MGDGWDNEALRDKLASKGGLTNRRCGSCGVENWKSNVTLLGAKQVVYFECRQCGYLRFHDHDTLMG
jgi:hypothetical protein